MEIRDYQCLTDSKFLLFILPIRQSDNRYVKPNVCSWVVLRKTVLEASMYLIFTTVSVEPSTF